MGSITYDFLLAIGTGVFSGIIAAIIFFLFLRIFKPRIKVGDKIVKERINNNDGTKSYRYVFKFINKSKANIENVSIDLFLMEDYLHGNGKNYRYKRLKLHQPEFKFLTGTKLKNNERHNNCVQMEIVEPLEDIWNGEKEWLHLQIDSTHSTSSRRRVIVKTFRDPKNTICKGRFDSGDTFDIIK